MPPSILRGVRSQVFMSLMRFLLCSHGRSKLLTHISKDNIMESNELSRAKVELVCDKVDVPQRTRIETQNMHRKLNWKHRDKNLRQQAKRMRLRKTLVIVWMKREKQ